jgi:surface carbohydrate biosynthesis protein
VKLVFTIPRRTKLVYFGRTGHGILRNYITEEDFVIYENPRETLNFWVALRMLLSSKRSEFAYYRAFLLFYRPEVVITMEDNNITFYATKVILNSCKSIAVQNGLRINLSHSRDATFRTELQRLNQHGHDADVIVTQGGLGTAFYRSSLPNSKGEFVEGGHLMNNAIAIEGVDVFERPKRLVYVSKYPNLRLANSTVDWHSQMMVYLNDTGLSATEYYRVDEVVARTCALIAQEHSLPFVVLGKRPQRQTSEYEFFAKHLTGLKWSYLPSDSQSSSYESLRTGDVVINTDSTLGYEFLARGLRTAFISARLSAAGHPKVRDFEFGYPVITQSRGSFWTNDSSDSEIRRVLEFVMWAEQTEWAEEAKFVCNSIFHFDPGNTILCRVLDDAGVANTGPRSWTRELIPAN